jgi:hypothetical protein
MRNLPGAIYYRQKPQATIGPEFKNIGIMELREAHLTVKTPTEGLENMKGKFVAHPRR